MMCSEVIFFSISNFLSSVGCVALEHAACTKSNVHLYLAAALGADVLGFSALSGFPPLDDSLGDMVGDCGKISIF